MRFDTRPPAPTTAHWQIRGYALTDLSATAGAVVVSILAGLRWMGTAPISAVELFLCFALFVLVPLGLGLVATPRQSERVSWAAVLLQFPAALAAVAAFTQPPTTARLFLLLPWATVTLLAGVVGCWRFASRGFAPVPELAVDAALLYLPVAGVFLLLHAAEVTFHFSSVIVLLTGVHFHYAGFALPLVAGVTGSQLSTTDCRTAGTLYPVAAGGILAGISAIAVAITVSPWLELPAVAGFSFAVVLFALVVLVDLVPAVDRLPGALLSVASVSILLTMGLAVAYAYSVFPGTGSVVTIEEMIRWHGTINALGFAFPGLLACRLL